MPHLVLTTLISLASVATGVAANQPGLRHSGMAASSALVFDGPMIAQANASRPFASPRPELARNNNTLSYAPPRARTALSTWPGRGRPTLDDLRRDGILRDFPLFFLTERFDLDRRFLFNPGSFPDTFIDRRFGPFRGFGDPRFDGDFGPGFFGGGFGGGPFDRPFRPTFPDLEPFFERDPYFRERQPDLESYFDELGDAFGEDNLRERFRDGSIDPLVPNPNLRRRSPFVPDAP